MGKLFKVIGDRRSASSASLPGIRCTIACRHCAQEPTRLARAARHPPRLLHARGRRVDGRLCEPQRRRRLERRRRPTSRRTAPAWRRRSASRRSASSPPIRSIRPTWSSAEQPWARGARPRADAHRHARPGLAIGVSTADCGPVLFADAAGARRSAPRMPAGAARSPACSRPTIAAMERLGAERDRIVAATGPMIRQPNYEVGPEFVARFTRGGSRQRALLQPAGGRPCAVRPARLHRRRLRARRHRPRRGPRPAAPMPTPRPFFSYRRSTHRASRTTAGTSTPSRSRIERARSRGLRVKPMIGTRSPGLYCQPRRRLVRTAAASTASLETAAMAMGKNGAIKLVAGNSNPALAEAIAAYLKTPLTKAVVRRFADMEIFVEIQENVRGADVFVHPVDLVPGQRPPDGAADHHRRAAPRLGAAHHRGDPLFRLCPAGPQTRRRARRSRPSSSPT